MNSISRRRRRPRVRSVSFRSFVWVLQREAVLRVLFPTQAEMDGATAARDALLKADSWAVRRLGEHALRCRPERRYWLPRAAE